MYFSRNVFYLCGFFLLHSCISGKNGSHVVFDDLLNQNTNLNNFPFIHDHERKKIEDIFSSSLNEELMIEKYANHQLVKKWIHYFSVKNINQMQAYLEKGEVYKDMIGTILNDHKIPTYLYYLALIESGFKVHARSHARAVGIWQFIEGTGKRFGLKINHFVDERRDPMRATLAAAKYLKSLYQVFNSWPLALAAYNAGESRVMNTIIKHSSRDFWDLCEKNALPRETQNYIPKFFAAVIVGTNHKRYGIHVNPAESRPPLVTVPTPSPIRLASLVETTGLSLSQLKTFNPHLLRGITPPETSSYRIWLPAGMERLAEKLASMDRLDLAKDMPRQATRFNPRQQATKTYQIAKGDTLMNIAKKFKSSPAILRNLNHLTSDNIKAGETIKIPELPWQHYRVRQGDNLINVARKFGMTVQKLKHLNAINHSRLYIGQVLKVLPSANQAFM